MRTPMVTMGLQNVMRDFIAAPIDITSQYDISGLEKQHKRVTSIQEDPIKVVNEIRAVLFDSNPDINYLPGIMARVFRYE